MINLILALVGIIILFFILLGIRQVLSKQRKKDFCVLCLSVSLTWVILLMLYFLGFFKDKMIIILLMGMSITGLYYYIDSKVNETLKIFKLPFMISLIFFVYTLLGGFFINALYFVLGLWVVFIALFLLKNNQKINVFVNKLIECCRRW